MAVIFIPGTVGSYQCLSTDIVANKVAGAFYKGAEIYVTDTQTWYRVLDDLTLAPMVGDSILDKATIVSASFAGVGAATLHAANTHVAPLAGGVVTIPNVFRTNGGSAYIMDITLFTSASSTVIVPRVHFFSGSAVTLSADSGSWVELYADRNLDLGYYTLPAMDDGAGVSTGAKSTSTDTSTTTHPAILMKSSDNSKNLYAAIETRTAFTTSASQLWTLKLNVDQN